MPALPIVAIAFAGGAFAGAVLGGEWWMAAGIAALAFVVTAVCSSTRISFLVLFATIMFAAAGHARFEAAGDQPPSLLATLDGPHDTAGTVRDDPHIRGTYATVVVDVDRVDGEPADGAIRLTLPAPSTPLEAGDRLEFTADIERPPVIEEFDYAAYLRTQGIDAVAAFPDRWAVVGHEEGWWLTARLRNIRGWSIANIERTLPEPESSLAVGLLLGAQRTMPDDLEEDLRQTGTTHLVVVSGQNIALLLGSAVALLAAVMSRRRAAVIAALVLLPAYVVLVGGEPPVVRAAIMAVGVAVATVFGRRTPGWVFLAYAAAFMLAVDPLLATSVSFRLSLAATAGVILLAPPLSEAVLGRLGLTNGGFAASVIEVAVVSIAASLMVFPVQAATFGTLPLLQIPANIAVAPFYQATLLASVVAVLVGAIEPLREVSGEALRLMPGAFIGIVRAFARIPATIEVSASLSAGIMWYALLGAALWLLHRRRSLALSPSTLSGLVSTFMLAIAAGGLWLAALVPTDRLASVTVLDVGQGLAILVRDGGNAVLIDTGPPDGAAIAALSRVGQRSSLDAVVLTHDDSDHTGGLAMLRQRYAVDTVLAAPESRTVDAHAFDIGDRIHLSDRTTIEVLSPPLDVSGVEDASDNNRSLVLLVTIGERRILLPADIEAEAERDLVASGIDLRADALVVPHHGSKTSSTAAFLDAVQPSVAVISVGASNSYGHPHPDVLGRYEDMLLLRTDLNGDVTVRSDGDGLWVHAARDGVAAEAGRTASASATVSPSPAIR